MRCNFSHISLLTGAMLLISPVLFAGPSPSKGDSAEGARLLRTVAAEARQIHMSASDFENLTRTSSATWNQYDRQWNETEPVVEMMQRNIARLEAIQSSLTADQKQALMRSKADCEKIARYSRELGNLVDQVPPALNSQQFRIESARLAKDAGDAASAAGK